MNRLLLGALVVAMLALTGLTAYNVFAPADTPQFQAETAQTEESFRPCCSQQVSPCCAGENAAACTPAQGAKAEQPADGDKP